MILLIAIEDFANAGIELPVEQELEQWQRYINEAQEFDLRPHLGDRFFYDLLANYSTTAYQDLLNGVATYVFETYNYSYQGLKAAICYYAYARYLPDSPFKDTDFGLMRKKNEYSDHVDSKFVKLRQTNAESVAKGYLDQSLLYLRRYATIDDTKYPIWNLGVSCASPSSPGFRISKVGNISGHSSYCGRFSDGVCRCDVTGINV